MLLCCYGANQAGSPARNMTCQPKRDDDGDNRETRRMLGDRVAVDHMSAEPPGTSQAVDCGTLELCRAPWTVSKDPDSTTKKVSSRSAGTTHPTKTAERIKMC
jgi:hypothetical protein